MSTSPAVVNGAATRNHDNHTNTTAVDDDNEIRVKPDKSNETKIDIPPPTTFNRHHRLAIEQLLYNTLSSSPIEVIYYIIRYMKDTPLILLADSQLISIQYNTDNHLVVFEDQSRPDIADIGDVKMDNPREILLQGITAVVRPTIDTIYASDGPSILKYHVPVMTASTTSVRPTWESEYKMNNAPGTEIHAILTVPQHPHLLLFVNNDNPKIQFWLYNTVTKIKDDFGTLTSSSPQAGSTNIIVNNYLYVLTALKFHQYDMLSKQWNELTFPMIPVKDAKDDTIVTGKIHPWDTTLVSVSNDHILLLGGRYFVNVHTSHIWSPHIFKYTISTNKWDLLPFQLPTTLVCFSCIYDEVDQFLMIAGGYISEPIFEINYDIFIHHYPERKEESIEDTYCESYPDVINFTPVSPEKPLRVQTKMTLSTDWWSCKGPMKKDSNNFIDLI